MLHNTLRCRQVTAEGLLASGFTQPVLLQPVGDSAAATAAALGMRLPPDFSLQSLAQQLGPQHRVPVIDVTSQDGAPHMSLGQVGRQ
jgi:hypothetical protein